MAPEGEVAQPQWGSVIRSNVDWSQMVGTTANQTPPANHPLKFVAEISAFEVYVYIKSEIPCHVGMPVQGFLNAFGHMRASDVFCCRGSMRNWYLKLYSKKNGWITNLAAPITNNSEPLVSDILTPSILYFIANAIEQESIRQSGLPNLSVSFKLIEEPSNLRASLIKVIDQQISEIKSRHEPGGNKKELIERMFILAKTQAEVIGSRLNADIQAEYAELIQRPLAVLWTLCLYIPRAGLSDPLEAGEDALLKFLIIMLHSCTNMNYRPHMFFPTRVSDLPPNDLEHSGIKISRETLFSIVAADKKWPHFSEFIVYHQRQVLDELVRIAEELQIIGSSRKSWLKYFLTCCFVRSNT